LTETSDSPITLRAVINDFIFTTWDFNKDNRIPRLNITLAWVGVHPLTGKRIYFVETMDPTGDTNDDPFNTTVIVSQFFSYEIDHFFGQVSRSAGLKTYGDVRYIFYKMPSTYYNITVTTVTDQRYDPEKSRHPATASGQAEQGRRVDYEIKIDWTGHTSPPKVRKGPAADVNDRLSSGSTWDMGRPARHRPRPQPNRHRNTIHHMRPSQHRPTDMGPHLLAAHSRRRLRLPQRGKENR
jgi:hypothetical protein